MAPSSIQPRRFSGSAAPYPPAPSGPRLPTATLHQPCRFSPPLRLLYRCRQRSRHAARFTLVLAPTADTLRCKPCLRYNATIVPKTAADEFVGRLLRASLQNHFRLFVNAYQSSRWSTAATATWVWNTCGRNYAREAVLAPQREHTGILTGQSGEGMESHYVVSRPPASYGGARTASSTCRVSNLRSR